MRFNCLEYLPPEADGPPVMRVILDHGVRHIHPETHRTHLQPELAHIDQALPARQSRRGIHCHLPGFIRAVVAVVEGGLHSVIVDLEHVRTLGQAAHKPPLAVLHIHVIRPDVGVRKFIALLFAGLLKPRMQIGGVPHDEVHHDADPLAARGVKQPLDILVRPKARINPVIVRNIISPVLKRRAVARIEPDRVAPQLRNVIQLFYNTGNIPHTVPVGIVKTGGIHLVKHGRIKPLVLHDLSSFSGLTNGRTDMISQFSRMVQSQIENLPGGQRAARPTASQICDRTWLHEVLRTKLLQKIHNFAN